MTAFSQIRGPGKTCGTVHWALRTGLDPVRLLAEIRHEQQALVTLADSFDLARSARPLVMAEVVPLETFVANLSTAWQNGEVRPTSKAKPKAKRGRRRPDPLAAVTDELRLGSTRIRHRRHVNLLTRLKATRSANPAGYPDAVLRTLQAPAQDLGAPRWLKRWCSVDPSALAQATGRSAANVDVSALQAVAVTIETNLTDFDYRYGPS